MWVCTVLQTLLQPRAEVEQLLSRLAFAGNEPLFLTYGSCETALVSKKVQPGCHRHPCETPCDRHGQFRQCAEQWKSPSMPAKISHGIWWHQDRGTRTVVRSIVVR